jgi:heavy metal sensor kinase
MFRSIRWTAQLWHAAILVVALGSFGVALDVSVRRGQSRDMNAELERAAHALAARLEHRPTPGDHGPPGDHGLPGDHGPPGEHEEHGPRGPRGHGPGLSPAALEELSPATLERIGIDEREQLYFVIWLQDGTRARASSPELDVPPPVLVRGGPHDPPQVRERDVAHDVVREVSLGGPSGTRILVGRSMAKAEEELARLRLILLGAGTGILAIGLLGGFVLTTRVTRPIEVMSAAARAISGSDLSRRIDVEETESELGSLAGTLNATFDRLEDVIQRQVRFTADASHELRTPLSVIHSHAELALARPRTAEEYRQTIETCHRAAKRMKALVESLLVLARSDAGRLELVHERFDLADVARESVALAETLAAERKVTIEVALAPVSLVADRTRLSQVVTNLVGNAIRYNKDGGRVRVTVATEGDAAVLTVADTGIGIARDDQPRVFERFFRADKARTSEAGGTGLGLAICHSIVLAHGGSIAFTSAEGEGTTFTVRLPLAG